jgi:hypothetical protein
VSLDSSHWRMNLIKNLREETLALMRSTLTGQLTVV